MDRKLFEMIEFTLKENLNLFKSFQKVANNKELYFRQNAQFKTEGWLQAILVHNLSKDFVVIPEWDKNECWDLAVWENESNISETKPLLIEMKCYGASQNSADLYYIKANINKIKNRQVECKRYLLIVIPECGQGKSSKYVSRIKNGLSEFNILKEDFIPYYFEENIHDGINLLWKRVI